MENPERLIGRKVRGFKFEEFEHAGFTETMESFIGKKGVIESYNKNTNCFLLRFDVDDFKQWAYPADQIEAHLVEDEIPTFKESNCIMGCREICNSCKVENEIPTLSDGVMMLVSFNDISWHERKVIGKKNGVFYGWNGDSILAYKSVKQIEPTKEEQLTAILGSSEKVSEIMEFFKKD